MSPRGPCEGCSLIWCKAHLMASDFWRPVMPVPFGKGCRIRGIPRLHERNRSPDPGDISRAADDFHRGANLHSGKKLCSKVFGHSHTTVRRRETWQITGMHSEILAEFHKVGHRSRLVVTTWRDV